MQTALANEAITLAHRPLFPKDSSVYFKNFTNVYIWRDVMNYHLYHIDGVPCLTGHYGNHPTFCFLPSVEEDAQLCSILETLRGELGSPLLLRPLEPSETQRIVRLYPNAEVNTPRSIQDYIYLQSDLSTLGGTRFHQKRNHVNNFKKKYNWEYVSVTPAKVPFLKEVAAHLFAVDSRLPDEYEAIQDILDHFEELELKAGVLLVDGTPVAYSIGEVMSPDTAVIHIEKADRSYDGAYAMINQLFAGEFEGCTYLNREEDMGIPGLRQAKSSYHPVKMGEYAIVKI